MAGRADRVAVMYAGQIVEEAPTARLFARPSHPYTQGLLRVGSPDQRARQAAHADRVAACRPPTAWPSGCRFRPRCPKAFDKSELEPPLLPVEPDHRMRCWLAGQWQTDDAPCLCWCVRDLVKHYQAGGLFGRVDATGTRRGRGVVRGRHRARRWRWWASRAAANPSVGRTILRLQEPTAGTRHFDGVDIFSLDRKALCARCGGGCRSSSRIPTARSIRE